MNEDQTIFMNQEPWLEDGSSQTKPKIVSNESQEPAKKGKLTSKKLILLAIVGITLLIVMVLSLVLLGRNQQPTPEPSPSPVASAQPKTQDPFAVRFQQVQADLKAADPAKNNLPFPPVDTQIKLEYGTQD